MRKFLLGGLLVITVFFSGCDKKTDETDKDPITNDPTNQVDDPSDLTNPLDGIDEALILTMGEVLEGIIEGDGKEYYFYLPSDTTFLISVEASFDSVVVIKEIGTNKVVFEGDDSIYGDDVYSLIHLTAGEYVLEISSFDDEGGTFSVSIGTENNLIEIFVDEEVTNTFTGDEIHGYLLEIEDSSYYRVISSSNLDIEGVITSTEGEFLAYNDDANDDEDFEMIVYLEAGMYIIGTKLVDDSFGSYELLVESFVLTHITSITENSFVNDYLVSGETNVVEFVVPSDGFVTLYLESDFDSYGILYNSNGEIIAENDDGVLTDFYIEQYLTSGTYTIEVSGYSIDDYGYYKLYYDFEEQIIGGTNVIELGNYMIESLSENETDIFTLMITEAVTVNIYSVSAYDLKAEIYTSYADLVADDDDSGEDTNFLFENLYLEPGTYFIHVTEFSASIVPYYELHANVAGENNQNGNVSSFDVELNSVVNATLDSGATHIYSFDAPASGLVSIYLHSNFDSSGSISNDQGVTIVRNDDGGYANFDFKIDKFELNEGSYTLSIFGYDSFEFGDYTLYIIFEENVNPLYEILPNGQLEGYIDNGITDTIQFTMPHAGYISAYLISGFDSVGSINEFGGSVLLSGDDYGSDKDFMLNGLYLEPGIYEIHISGFTLGEYGDYELHLDVVYGNEEFATMLIMPADYQANLDSGESTWYQIELLEDGYLYSYVDSPFDTYGYLLDEFGKIILQDDDAHGGGDFQLSWYLTAGTYYIVVQGYSMFESGGYTLHAEFTPPSQ